MSQYNLRQRALFTDVHGPLLETYLGTERLKKGSLESLRSLKSHIESESEPKIIAIVSGDSDTTLQRHFARAKIEILYRTVEHGLGIKLPGREVVPTFEVDSRYEWLREPIEQLAEIRRMLQIDMPYIKQAYKQFMVAPYVPPEILPQEFQSYILYHLDGLIDLSRFNLTFSHGALDIRPKNYGKIDGVIVLRDALGLRKEQIVGLEDNDFGWLEEVGYACCPTPSSEETLDYVKNRERNGTGRVFPVDYRGIVIKQAIELIQHAT